MTLTGVLRSAAVTRCVRPLMVLIVGFLLGASPAAASPAGSWRVLGTIDLDSLTALSCPSSRLCVAGDASGTVLASMTPATSRSWAATSVDPGHALVGMACPSVSLCIGVDSGGNIVSGDLTGWQVAASGASSLTAVACPSVSLCVIGDGDGGTVSNPTEAQTAGSVLISTDPAGGVSTWSKRTANSSLGPECGKYGDWVNCGNSILAVSCPSTSLCVTVDQWGEATQSNDPSDGAASNWAGAPGGEHPVITSLSCPSASLCVGTCPTGDGMLDDECPGTSDFAGEVFTWDPTTGRGGRVLQLSQDPLNINCAAATLCFAFDGSGNLWVSSHPAAGSWELLRQASPARRKDPITAVACPSRTSWIAADAEGQLLTGGAPLTAGELSGLLLNMLREQLDAINRRRLLSHAGYRISFAAPLPGTLHLVLRSTAKRSLLFATGTAQIANPGRIGIALRPTPAGQALLRQMRVSVPVLANATFSPKRGPTGHARRAYRLGA